MAAKRGTTELPVVMATMMAPGAIVASFARPGRNITGVTTFSTLPPTLLARADEVIE